MASFFWQTSGGRKEETSGNEGVREEFWLFEYAHVNQQDSLQEANYKFDNTARTLSDE